MLDEIKLSPLKIFGILEIIKRHLFLYLDVKYLIRLAICCHDSYNLVRDFSNSLYSIDRRSNPLLGFLLSNILPLDRLRYEIQTVNGTLLKTKLPNLEFRSLYTRLEKIQSQTSRSTSCDSINEKTKQLNISNTLKTSSSMINITRMFNLPNTQLQRFVVLRNNTYLLKLDTDNVQNLCTLTLSRFIKYRKVNTSSSSSSSSRENEGYWLTRVCGAIRPRYHFSIASHDDYGIVLSGGYNEEMKPLNSVVYLSVTYMGAYDFVAAIRVYNNVIDQSRFGHSSCFIDDILWITGGAAHNTNNTGFGGGLSTLKSVECIDFSPTRQPIRNMYIKKKYNSNSEKQMAPLEMELSQMQRCTNPNPSPSPMPRSDPRGVASMNSIVAMIDTDTDNDSIQGKSQNSSNSSNDDDIHEDDEFIVGDCLLCRVRYKVDDSESSAVIGGNALHCAMCHSRENMVFGLGLYDIGSNSSSNAYESTFDAMPVESNGGSSSSSSSSSSNRGSGSRSNKDFRSPNCLSINGISSSSSSRSDSDLQESRSMLCGRYKHQMLSLNGCPCVVGGNNGPLSIEICDPVTFKWSLVAVLDDPIQSYSVFPLGTDLCLFADAGSVPPGQWKDITGVTYKSKTDSKYSNNDKSEAYCDYDMTSEYGQDDAVGIQALIVKLPKIDSTSTDTHSGGSDSLPIHVTSSYHRYPLHSQLGARPMDVFLHVDIAK